MLQYTNHIDILPDSHSFEWDEGNIPKNLHKHDVTYKEAEEMFGNQPLVTIRDPSHSRPRDTRFGAYGKTDEGRKLFAAFIVRGNKVRVILVRDMTQAEGDAYEEFEKDT